MTTTDADFLEYNNPQLPAMSEITLTADKKAPLYPFRAMFRPVLMHYFEQTDKRVGSYLVAENMAKQHFLKTYGIPVSAWNYR